MLYIDYNIYFQQEYFNRNPQGLNPVQINDVVFSVHAALATFLTIVQCLIYEVIVIKNVVINIIIS